MNNHRLFCSLAVVFLCTLVDPGCREVSDIRDRVTARSGMVVSGHRLASEIGVHVLKMGGNAVDAAVAVGFALAVVYPEAGNIGGGGFMVIRQKDGSSSCIDFREIAPRASTRDMYIGREDETVDGPLASGVPGTVDGLLRALHEYGSLDLPDILQPSITLAFKGFTVDSNLSATLREYQDLLKKHPSTRKIFFSDNVPLPEGTTLVQEDLGHTLERIRDQGREGFYSGTTASMIVSAMDGRGLIDTGDLSDYRSVVRPVLKGYYRGYEVLSAGLPSSGGICLLKTLQLLEPYDLGRAGFHSEKAVHLVTESLKRSFSMRAAYLGDPAFSTIPVPSILSSDAGTMNGYSLDEEHAVPSDSLAGYPGVGREGSETTHYSVIDRDGMAVAVTYTINDLFGNKIVVSGAGFFLNDEMDDFVTVPGSPNMYGLVGGEENMVQPGKRPLSSMSPTILVRDGRPVLILGARGGSKIISSVAQVILNIVDFGLTPERAVSEPRFHHQWKPDVLEYERGALTPRIVAGLISRGHRPQETLSTIGQVEAIFVEPGTGLYIGLPDPRENGVASGF